jgi:hypothetical protein
VVQIVLDALPVPDDSVSWEQIRDLRNDADLQKQFLDLRRWMNGLATGNYVLAEAQEEMEFLMAEYQSSLRRRRLKTATTRLAAVLKAGAPFLGKTVGPIAFGLGVVVQRLGLLPGEVKDAGNEIAYIVTTQRKFS